MKLCKDCKHCWELGDEYGNLDYRYATCARTDVIVGTGYCGEPCSVMRDQETKCGRDAKWWEPK